MKPLIVANWKLNPSTAKEAKSIYSGVRSKKVEVVFCPPFVFIPLLKGVILGAQDCFFEEKGAFTGQVSPLMLKDLKVKYVIIGHSERRKYFQETEDLIEKKLKAVLKAGLKPILCIGETKEQRDNNETEAILKKQLNVLKSIHEKELVIAYEPVWAIGTGNACDAHEAQTMRLLILKTINGLSFAKKTKVLYGGSANSKNAEMYIKEAGFSGLLVGGASLDKKEFLKVIKSST